MQWLNNLKVGKKLALLIIVFVLALLSVSGIGYYYLQRMQGALNTMYAERLVAVELINENRAHARAIEADLYALMLSKQADTSSILGDISKRADTFDKNLKQYERLPLDSAEQQKIDELRKQLDLYRSARKPVVELINQQKNEEAYILYETQVKPLSDPFQKTLIELGEYEKNAAAGINEKNKAEFSQAVLLFIIILVVAIAVGLSLGWIIAKSILRRLQDTVSFLNRIADSDFTQNIKKEHLQDKSEFGTLSQAADRMNQNIRSLIKQLSHTAKQLAASSEELSASAEQSAQASGQVAESVTEVATGASKQLDFVDSTTTIVEEMAGRLEHVVQTTLHVSESSGKTSRAAADGEAAIRQAIAQMNTIEEKTNETAAVITELEAKSSEIQQIVEVISNISGQTNLLALNAAIEAARAGEAGRGFAVVADEVRNLAEQSAVSAKTIAGLIGEIQQKTSQAVSTMKTGAKEVQTGSQVVDMAGTKFRQIMDMIEKISSQITDITSAIEQINHGSVQAATAVQEINRETKNTAEQTQTISAATEQQSASMQEIASSSQNLAKLAEDLQIAVLQFKI